MVLDLGLDFRSGDIVVALLRDIANYDDRLVLSLLGNIWEELNKGGVLIGLMSLVKGNLR